MSDSSAVLDHPVEQASVGHARLEGRSNGG